MDKNDNKFIGAQLRHGFVNSIKLGGKRPSPPKGCPDA